MVRRRYLLLLVTWLFLLIASQSWAQTLQVIDAEGHATSFSAAQIAALPHVKLDALDHDKPAQFEGVPLAKLLAAAGIQLGDTLRGARMAEALLAEAADGYKVVFALAEFDPAFATREIILADKRDGKALDAKEGPFRVVVPGDKRPARWIRQVTSLKVVVVK
jgi:hypothetical protein